MKIKKTLAIVLTVCLFATSFAFAEAKNDASPLVDGYYSWQVDSKTVVDYTYGSWRDGPSGRGPCTLTLTNESATSIEVSNTITGKYSSKKNIEAALGIKIGVVNGKKASHSINVPSGVTKRIIYRPYYKKIKVVEQQYFIDHGQKSATGNKKTSYVTVYVNWDYSSKTV